MTLLVTGGAGFIGANFVQAHLATRDEKIIVLDKLTYAGNLANLDSCAGDARYVFVKGDIGDVQTVASLLETYRPRAIVNFAAETHVDRSIASPAAFIDTNIVGFFRLLEATLAYWRGISELNKAVFRFLHISTDEVYGTLSPSSPPFTEESRVLPNSPYSASKAASDHLVRAYHQTYGLPTLTTNCSNNYGPYQHPEKLVPGMIDRALRGQMLTIYGDGQQIRDWLYVGDHCNGIFAVLEKGRLGEVYNIGGNTEKTNLEVISRICEILDALRPQKNGKSYKEAIIFVADRPGHDRRYAIDATKMQTELGWKPGENFESGLEKTILWYLDNQRWIEALKRREQAAAT